MVEIKWIRLAEHFEFSWKGWLPEGLVWIQIDLGVPGVVSAALNRLGAWLEFDGELIRVNRTCEVSPSQFALEAHVPWYAPKDIRIDREDVASVSRWRRWSWQ